MVALGLEARRAVAKEVADFEARVIDDPVADVRPAVGADGLVGGALGVAPILKLLLDADADRVGEGGPARAALALVLSAEEGVAAAAAGEGAVLDAVAAVRR